MERASSSVTTFQFIGKKSRRKYTVKVPDYVASCHEEIERLIENNLKEVKENNEIVRGIKLLRKPVKLSRRVSKKRRLRLGRMKQVSSRCEELRQKYWNQQKDDDSAELTDDDSAELTDDDSAELTDDDSAELTDDDSAELSNEYSDKICDYIQEQLNVTFNLREEDARYKELGDVFFYYMMRGQEPDKSAQTIFWSLFDPLDKIISVESYSWFEFSCFMLFMPVCFSQFYKRLNNNRTALLYILYKFPQLLLNKESDWLISSLIEHLPYDMLHQAIANIRDKNKQTCLFYMTTSLSFVKLYKNHIEDLVDLLLVRNTNGQTALHVNTWDVTDMLANIYTPDKRDAFLKLASITNVNDESFSSLMRRIEDNEYITSTTGYGTRIIIIYHTNNRPGAEEHAQTIYNACKSKYRENSITLKKNLTEDQIITLIREIYSFTRLMIVTLMSQGNVGTIDDCDGKPIKLSVIEEAMCSDYLQGKPKMLITECCQIGDESVKTPAYAPTHDDFCAVMSCVSGQPSQRGVFLGKLADKIKNSKKDTNISKLVNSVSAEMKREEHPQTPIIMSTLKANFCPTDNWDEPK